MTNVTDTMINTEPAGTYTSSKSCSEVEKDSFHQQEIEKCLLDLEPFPDFAAIRCQYTSNRDASQTLVVNTRSQPVGSITEGQKKRCDQLEAKPEASRREMRPGQSIAD